MSQNNGCACNNVKNAPRLIFACSGAADVGEVSDRAARAATQNGAGKMYCLAGIGGGVEPILETTRGAAAIVAVDGCASDCVRHTLENAGFSRFSHLRLSDMGMEKGQSPATPERVQQVSGEIERLLAR